MDPTRPVRGFYDAINAGDVDRALAVFADDVTWARPPDVPVTGTLVGIEAVAKMWRAFAGALKSFEMEPTRLREDGHRVLAAVTFRGEPEDGAGFEFAGFQIFAVRDGQIAAVEEYRSLPEAREAFGAQDTS